MVYQQPTQGNETGMQVFVNPQPEVVRLWRENARAFEAVEPYTAADQALRGGGWHAIDGARRAVLPSFAAFTGTRPIIGRAFTEADWRRASASWCSSEPFWRSRFGGDTALIGKPITLEREPYTVIGVMPVGYRLPRLSEAVSDVWMPLDLRDGAHGLSVIARLRPNVDDGGRRNGAQRDLHAVGAREAQPGRLHDEAQLAVGAGELPPVARAAVGARSRSCC